MFLATEKQGRLQSVFSPDLNPRLALHSKWSNAPGESFLRMHFHSEVHFVTFWPTWSSLVVAFCSSEHRLSLQRRHKASGASPPPLPLLLRPYVTHTYARARCTQTGASSPTLNHVRLSHIGARARARAPSDFSRGLIGCCCTGPFVKATASLTNSPDICRPSPIVVHPRFYIVSLIL